MARSSAGFNVSMVDGLVGVVVHQVVNVVGGEIAVEEIT
jgi:hypothetical protein